MLGKLSPDLKSDKRPFVLTLSDNLCKQIGPRTGSKLFDTLMVFLKDFFLT